MSTVEKILQTQQSTIKTKNEDGTEVEESFTVVQVGEKPREYNR